MTALLILCLKTRVKNKNFSITLRAQILHLTATKGKRGAYKLRIANGQLIIGRHLLITPNLTIHILAALEVKKVMELLATKKVWINLMLWANLCLNRDSKMVSNNRVGLSCSWTKIHHHLLQNLPKQISHCNQDCNRHIWAYRKGRQKGSSLDWRWYVMRTPLVAFRCSTIQICILIYIWGT